MKYKRIRMIAAMLLALAMVSGACAESVLTEFYDAGTRLLFETENVTLTGHAEFSLDGEWFKTAEGTCIQAGDDAYQRLRLTTPLADGSNRETGYTVVAKGSQVSAIEDYYPQYYREYGRNPDQSIIKPTVYLNSLMAMGRMVAGAMEPGLEGKVTAGVAENGGRRLDIRLGAGESPAILNGIVTMVGEYLAEAYLGISYRYFRAEVPEEGPNYTISDWSALFAGMYAKEYGEEMPENYYELMWTEEGDKEIRALYLDRYDVISQRIEALISDILSRYEEGYIEILPDGTWQYYARQDDYLIDKEMQYVMYEDFVTTVRRNWEKAYGEAMSEADFYAIFDDGDEERLEKYNALTETMEEESLKKIREDGKAAAVWICADGTEEPIEDLEAWYNRDRIRHVYSTVTVGIAYCMRALAVDEAEICAETDGEGRLAGVRGTLKLTMTDDMRQDHALEITFRFDAGAYGESTVEAFDPAAYGVIPWPQQ